MGENNPNIDIVNISVLVEFNLEEAKSKYIKNRKIALSELFETLRCENDEVFYNNNRITIICKNEKSNLKFFIYPSGKLSCWGARSEEEICKAMENCFQKVIDITGVKKHSLSITNIVASAMLDYYINLEYVEAYDGNDCEISYEPGSFPALTYKSKFGAANIFRNGKINMFVKKAIDANLMIKHIEEIISMKKAKIPLSAIGLMATRFQKRYPLKKI